MSQPEATVELSESLLDDLSKITDEATRAQFLEDRELPAPAVVQRLNEASREKLRVDPRQSFSLAEAAVSISKSLQRDELLGPSLRAKANALYVLGDNAAALGCHAQALAIFQRQSNAEEEARTLNASIQPHILLGNYDAALEAAKAARDIFERLGDRRRLAHIEINVGNLYHRQDRFEEALACYERACEMFLVFDDSEGIGISLYNMSVCLISMNDFPRALSTYERARGMFVARGMKLLVNQADYNIAYLYYLRGEYGRAVIMLRAAREQSEANGDAHILALCYLDLSDIYLELNLSSEAAQVAHVGVQRFQKLGMGYEEAKCLANEAIAWSQQGKHLRALDLFAEARSVFVRENNRVWPWLIDLYRALALFDEGSFFEARKSCTSALQFFETSTSPGKAVLCRLLLSRIELGIGNCAEALAQCKVAMSRLAKLDSPSLEYQAHYVMGQIHAKAGHPHESYFAYQKAREQLETLWPMLRKEELKLAFVKDKMEVYARLIEFCLNQDDDIPKWPEVFQYIELTKYRGPAEILLTEIHEMPESVAGNSEMVRRLRDLREELNWYYHRIEIAQLSSDQNDPPQIETLQQEARAREQALIDSLQDIAGSTPQSQPLRTAAVSSLETIQASLGPDVSLIEYFAVGDQLFAALLTNRILEIFPVTLLSSVSRLVQRFRAQMFRLSFDKNPERASETAALRATQECLQSLYNELLDPLIDHISGEHIVVVPQSALHSVAFHALFDGSRYLIDSFTVSYAPSASLYSDCRYRSPRDGDSSLVLGLGTEDVELQSEVSSFAGARQCHAFSGNAATAESALREFGPAARWIYIANLQHRPKHEVPLAGNRSGNFHLNMSCVYQLQLQPELVALTGFAAGLDSDPIAGEDSFALTRCFLESGAKSVLSTLWNVRGPIMNDFLSRFCGGLNPRLAKAKLFQISQQEIRALYPNPLHWAPFSLSGHVLLD